MDFQKFGIDARLAEAAEGLPIDFFFYEKMLSHAVENRENICAKLNLDEGREEVLLLPALQWVLSGEFRRVLVVVPDSDGGDRCAAAIGRLGSGAGIGLCRVFGEADGQVRIEGDPAAEVLIGALEELLASSELNLRDYGFLVVDGADRLAELSPDAIHKFIVALLPSWERRTLLACAKISVKAKNLAWDLADNPVEISIDGEIAKAQSVAKETWNLPGEAKLKFLLGLLARDKPARACVFCNLKDTAEEVSRRLGANGIRSDYILGALAADRKLAVLEKVKSGESLCLVLTDQGAEGLEGGVFPLVVNYDIPLEPEFFVKRIEMLDRAVSGAKVVNLACDRYIYGLPAVESYIDASLNALPADESMFNAEDKSEGMNFGRRERQGETSRSGSGDSLRAQGRRAQNRGEGRSEGRGQRRDSYAREDRSPDIRKSIAEATGSSLEMGSSSPPASKPRAQGEARRQAPKRKNEGPREDSRRDGGRAKQSSQRGQPPKQGAPRLSAKPGASGKGLAKKGPPKMDPASPRNPYDMPIEERMKRYREKYGQGLGPEKQGPSTREAQHGSSRQRKGSPKGQKAAAQKAPPKVQGGLPNSKPEGLVGHLFGAFKNKINKT